MYYIHEGFIESQCSQEYISMTRCIFNFYYIVTKPHDGNYSKNAPILTLIPTVSDSSQTVHFLKFSNFEKYYLPLKKLPKI